ncbi:MAG: response regulator [Candidatus Margulisbacteria bacterium]|nr:response regulator [Candidatus Margulisiibacteriota bacterium]
METRKTVLIVDDDQTLIDVLEISFSILHNIIIEKAYSGEESIVKAEQIIPDLIIMDYKMPGMNGWEAAKRIKANPKTENIPIIGYTAWAGLEDVKRGLNSGIVEIVTKPIDLDAWEEKLQKYLG